MQQRRIIDSTPANYGNMSVHTKYINNKLSDEVDRSMNNESNQQYNQNFIQQYQLNIQTQQQNVTIDDVLHDVQFLRNSLSDAINIILLYQQSHINYKENLLKILSVNKNQTQQLEIQLDQNNNVIQNQTSQLVIYQQTDSENKQLLNQLSQQFQQQQYDFQQLQQENQALKQEKAQYLNMNSYYMQQCENSSQMLKQHETIIQSKDGQLQQLYAKLDQNIQETQCKQDNDQRQIEQMQQKILSLQQQIQQQQEINLQNKKQTVDYNDAKQKCQSLEIQLKQKKEIESQLTVKLNVLEVECRQLQQQQQNHISTQLFNLQQQHQQQLTNQKDRYEQQIQQLENKVQQLLVPIAPQKQQIPLSSTQPLPMRVNIGNTQYGSIQKQMNDQLEQMFSQFDQQQKFI